MKTKDDPDLLGLMMLMGATQKIISKYKVDKEIAYGYNGEGKELVSVPLREPTFTRKYFDEAHDVYLHNIT